MTQFCVNHPNIKAISFCHSCKDYFCRDCLVEGNEFYYCKKEECQEKFNVDNEQKVCNKKIVKDQIEKHNPKLLDEFQNKMFSTFIISAIVATFRELFIINEHQEIVSLLFTILGGAIGIILIPFILSLISIPFLRRTESRSIVFYRVFMVIWISIMILLTFGLYYQYRGEF